MRFKDYFSNDFETMDNSYDNELRTHYYRCKYEDCLKAINDICTEEKAQITNQEDNYQEILIEAGSYSCTFKVTNTTPVESAIDIKITTFSLLPLGKGRKIIIRLYKLLDSKLPFKGIGLYKEM